MSLNTQFLDVPEEYKHLIDELAIAQSIFDTADGDRMTDYAFKRLFLSKKAIDAYLSYRKTLAELDEVRRLVDFEEEYTDERVEKGAQTIFEMYFGGGETKSE